MSLDGPATPAVSSFVDEGARPWEVREIREHLLPERRSPLTQSAFANGWLLFTCGVERRRLAPPPSDWRSADEESLRRWCREALPVPGPPS